MFLAFTNSKCQESPQNFMSTYDAELPKSLFFVSMMREEVLGN
jgi:hypothetical protein